MLSRIKSFFTKTQNANLKFIKEGKRKAENQFYFYHFYPQKNVSKLGKKKFILFSFSYRQSRNQFTLEKSLLKEILRKRWKTFSPRKEKQKRK